MKPSQSYIFLLITPFLFSCNNNASKEVMNNFDSINQSLQKTNNSVNQSSTELYQLLEKKWANSDKEKSLQLFRHQISGFYIYMKELNRRFIVACGDSTGTALPTSSYAEDAVGLTNDFFENNDMSRGLVMQLGMVKDAFRTMNTDSTLILKINQLTDHPGKSFNRGWFYNIPPLAALTLLHKFENDVKYLEENLLSNLMAK